MLSLVMLDNLMIVLELSEALINWTLVGILLGGVNLECFASSEFANTVGLRILADESFPFHDSAFQKLDFILWSLRRDDLLEIPLQILKITRRDFSLDPSYFFLLNFKRVHILLNRFIKLHDHMLLLVQVNRLAHVMRHVHIWRVVRVRSLLWTTPWVLRRVLRWRVIPWLLTILL